MMMHDYARGADDGTVAPPFTTTAAAAAAAVGDTRCEEWHMMHGDDDVVHDEELLHIAVFDCLWSCDDQLIYDGALWEFINI